MTSVSTTTNGSLAEVHYPNGTYSAERWLEYFRDNRDSKPAMSFPKDHSISAALRVPLIHSLQRFQIGETGEGNHLRKYARLINDPHYDECIDLFIKEEQSHARILAEMIASLDGTLLTWHWTDFAFIALRRMLKLKTELFILLIAEIIGKCFYHQCARNIPNPQMSDAFSLIVLDEIAHLEFHTEFLRTQMEPLSEPLRHFIYCCWSLMFYAACLVFVFDHRETLKALGGTYGSFLQECSRVFRRAAMHTLQVE